MVFFVIRININGTFILSLDIVNMVDFFLIRCLCELVLSYLGYIGIEEGVEYMFIGLKRERIILGFFFF